MKARLLAIAAATALALPILPGRVSAQEVQKTPSVQDSLTAVKAALDTATQIVVAKADSVVASVADTVAAKAEAAVIAAADTVKAEAEKYAINGNALRPDQLVSYAPEDEQDRVKPEQLYENDTKVRLYNETGDFFGAYRYDAKKRVFVTEKFLYGAYQ